MVDQLPRAGALRQLINGGKKVMCKYEIIPRNNREMIRVTSDLWNRDP